MEENPLEDSKDDLSSKKKFARKKHWPLNVNINLPGRDAVMKLEVSSSMKVKNLRKLIYDTAE